MTHEANRKRGVVEHFKRWGSWAVAAIGLSVVFDNLPVTMGQTADLEQGDGPRGNAAVGYPLTDEGSTPPLRRLTLASDPPAYSHGEPTAQEQLMLELVNRARRDAAAEAARFGLDLNDGLAPNSLTAEARPPLAFHAALIAAARAHSDWMLDVGLFSHAGRDGSTPGDRMRVAGYVFSGAWNWGENIARQGTTSLPDPTAYTIAEHELLFRSAGHRKNLLNARFAEVGIGVRMGAFAEESVSLNTVMITQNFASSAVTSGPIIVGVVFADRDGDGFYSVGEGEKGLEVACSPGGCRTTTSASGGYALPVGAPSSTVTVTVSGPVLVVPIVKTVVLGDRNVKVDFNLTEDAPLRFVAESLHLDDRHNLEVELRGPPGARVEVLSSSDLIAWQSLGQHTLKQGRLILADPSLPHLARFYRAVMTR